MEEEGDDVDRILTLIDREGDDVDMRGRRSMTTLILIDGGG